MNEDDNKGKLFQISGVLIFLAALGVITFTQIPFRGSRPSVPEIREPFEKARARLWQDPFCAVLDHVKAGGTGSVLNFCLYSTANDKMKVADPLVNRLKENGKKGKVTVLGVMVFGAPYAEETEMRIRHRYAVLSGLGRLGFVPEDPEHIEFITMATLNDPVPGKISMSNIMPFEWLAREENGREDSVLLLWINDEVFREAPPLAGLARLVDFLGFKDENNLCLKNKIRFKVIGPAGSTTLRAMLEEMGTEEVAAPLKKLSGLEIYSAMATADGSLLLRSINEKASAENADGRIEAKFLSHGIIFRRTIGSDRKLAEKLIEELDNRRMRPKTSKDHIVLISEWDTYYGRSLPETFTSVLCGGVPREKKMDKVASRVWRISYLRGLDGSLPGEKEGKGDEREGKGGEEAQTKNNAADNIKKLEQPTGKSQYDYLRRLAEETYRLDQHLKMNKQGSIKAIGVLGSDFYDKYLVLQALRQRFPQAIYFTTDLDARLLHPDNIEWTRNLVVASNFNLALRKDDELDIQGDVPPFRDNYQTSIFFAIFRAFIGENYLNKNVENVVKQPLHPLIFEIGRHKAIDLTASEGFKADNIHPAKNESENSKILIEKSAVIALLLIILLCFSSVSVKKAMKTALTGLKHLVITCSILLLLSIVVFCFYQGVIRSPYEEPFSFFEGVSIWPTEILRVIACIFSLFFLWYSWKSLKENNEDVAKEFGFNGSSETDEFKGPDGNVKPQKTGILGNISMRLKEFWTIIKYDWEVDSKGKGLTMEVLWAEYLRRDSWRYRIPRLLPIVIPYFVLCGLLIRFDIPISPVRGPVSFWFDKAVLFGSVFSFIALNFYVFDVTRLCQRFINIAETKPEWSQRSLELFPTGDGGEVKAPIKEWMLVHLIAKRTDVVGKLIFYPFIVWFIMFISRINYFDNWQTPIGLAIAISMGAVYAWSCAFVLRRSAERARTDVVHRLATHLALVLSNKNPDQNRVKRIEFVLNEVKSIREGAFAPFTQHPVVQALLVPFGGVGGIYLIDFLAKLNV